MNASGRSSAVLIGFVLSTVAAAIILSIAVPASAAVLFDNGTAIGTTYSTGAAGSADLEFLTNRSVYYPFTPVIYTLTAPVSFFKIKAAAGGDCDFTGSTAFYFTDTSFSQIGTITTTPSISGDFCTYTVSGTSIGQGIANIVMCSNGSCSTGSSHLLDGSPSNTGGSFTGATTYIGTGGPAYQLCDSGGCSGGFVPPPPADTSSRIIEISPATGSTTASTAVPFSITYYANSADGFDSLGYTLWDVTENYALVFGGTVAAATQDAITTFSTTTTLISGHTYSWSAGLLNTALVFSISSRGQTEGASANGTSEFSVVTNNLISSLGASSTGELFTLATTTCSFTNISGCFQNAIAWAFYPSADMMQLVAQDGGQIKMRPPVGNVFSTIAALQSLSGTGTPAFVLATDAPIMTYIFEPLTNALIAAVWFLFGVGLFRRVRDLDI